MSNRLVIQPTEFVNLPTKEKSYGVRIYNDYENMYVDNWDEMPDDDMGILVKTLHSCWQTDMLGYCIENKEGCLIGKKWYCWENFEEIVNDFFEGVI